MAISLETSLGPVILKEEWDRYVKGVSRDRGPYIRKVYLLQDWAYSDAVCNALMGGASSTTVDGPISRIPPHLCDESPNLVCLDAECEGMGEVDVQDGGRPRFEWGRISAEYGIAQGHGSDSPLDNQSIANNQLPNDDAPGQPVAYEIHSYDIGEETIKVPGSAYKFSTAPQIRSDVPVMMSIGVADITITREAVPYLPFDMIFQKINKLNDRKFLGFERGTLKFKGGRPRFTVMSDGTRARSVDFRFKFREFDHNKQHRPDENSFDFVVDDLGNKMYSYTDLRPLLR